MIRKIKIAAEILLAVFFMLVMIFSELTIYGIGQARGQYDILSASIPVSEVLEGNYPDSVKHKLILIKEIRKFAFDSLGINPNENYTKFYDHGNKPLLWVVTASEPLQLKAKEWTFPLLGSVSYKGFFRKEKAIDLENEIKKEGLDTDIGKVTAWSTLGFFTDPVLSGMLRYTEGQLADLIIHELTHGTLYVPSNVDFNENLASFIGEKGAELYMAGKYGVISSEYSKFIHDRLDQQAFDKYTLETASRLDSLFKTSLPDKVKANRKKQVIEAYSKGILNLGLHNPDRFVNYGKKAKRAGNAYFMSFVRYDSKKGDFEKELVKKFGNDLKKYLKHLRKIYPSV